MNHSDTIKEIAAALPKAQAAIKTALKDANNPHFKSKYADLSSIIDAVKDPLNSNGITVLQPVRQGEGGVDVETVLLHSSGEWISTTLSIPVSKNDAQAVGSAITYGRRYGLQSLCGVPADDDDGNAATAKPPARAAAHDDGPRQPSKFLAMSQFVLNEQNPDVLEKTKARVTANLEVNEVTQDQHDKLQLMIIRRLDALKETQQA